ncbi:unnamed protein product [Allacma fusca]|uniref:Uncharacterized protein n=1 Tax=Allacma fusca TaxID=39272 RepID=A0A8J2K2R1_9HEXA|nr:unnamed protein product [Allacma fusca]
MSARTYVCNDEVEDIGGLRTFGFTSSVAASTYTLELSLYRSSTFPYLTSSVKFNDRCSPCADGQDSPELREAVTIQ